MSAEAGLGIKYAAVVAGFSGAVVSLSFLKELTVRQAIAAVFTGTVTAAYLTPIGLQVLNNYLSIGEQGEMAAAFIVGLCAMNIIPGIVKISERLKSGDFPKGKE